MPPPSTQHSTCSGYLIASYLANLLFVVEAVLYIKCMFWIQRRFTRLFVTGLIAADIVVHLCLLGDVFAACSLLGPQKRTSPRLPTGMILRSLIGVCEHLYLIFRFYLMSKSIPLTIVLVTFTTAQCVMQVVAAAWVINHSHLPLPKSLNYYMIMAGWAIGAAVDLLIAMALLWQLLRFRVVFSSTKSLIRKFVVCTVVSGGLTALYGVLLLIFSATIHEPHIIFAQNFAKIYAITIFASLALVQGTKKRSTVVLRANEEIPGMAKLPTSIETPTDPSNQSSKKESTIATQPTDV